MEYRWIVQLSNNECYHQIAQVLETEFTGQLKDRWDKYLDESTREQILNYYVIRPTTQIIKEEDPSTRKFMMHHHFSISKMVRSSP